MDLAILYSFRRCPYAIRARYMLALLNTKVILREVVLKHKPQALLDLGGRSSVPQLLDSHGNRYPESMDIIHWALSKTEQRELAQSLLPSSGVRRNKIRVWLWYNDHVFKFWLDRYKYADRYPERCQSEYRAHGEVFLRRLNHRLSYSAYVLGEQLTLADIVVFPFIRQFAAVDSAWFAQAEYPHLKRWLNGFLDSDLFASVMKKYPAWEASQPVRYFPEGENS